MTPGIYYNVPMAEYRSSAGVNQSSLKAIMRSPAHYLAGVDPDDEREDTEALILGRLVSSLVLEPEAAPWWTIKPDGIKFNDSDGRAWAKTLCGWDDAKDGKFPRGVAEVLAQRGITVLSNDMFQTAARMATALQDSRKPEVRDMLDGAKREVSVWANVATDAGGVLCKSRPDIVPVGNVLADLKTTLDARQDPFNRSVRKYGYHVQGFSYLHQWNSVCRPGDLREVFLLLAIEKFPPFAHMVHKLDADFLAEGEMQYMTMLNLYARCNAANEWPEYPPGINTLSLNERYQTHIE